MIFLYKLTYFNVHIVSLFWSLYSRFLLHIKNLNMLVMFVFIHCRLVSNITYHLHWLCTLYLCAVLWDYLSVVNNSCQPVNSHRRCTLVWCGSCVNRWVIFEAVSSLILFLSWMIQLVGRRNYCCCIADCCVHGWTTISCITPTHHSLS